MLQVGVVIDQLKLVQNGVGAGEKPPPSLVRAAWIVLRHVSSWGYARENWLQLYVWVGEWLVFPMKIAECKPSKTNSPHGVVPAQVRKGRDPTKEAAPRLVFFAGNRLVKKTTGRASVCPLCL